MVQLFKLYHEKCQLVSLKLIQIDVDRCLLAKLSGPLTVYKSYIIITTREGVATVKKLEQPVASGRSRSM